MVAGCCSYCKHSRLVVSRRPGRCSVDGDGPYPAGKKATINFKELSALPVTSIRATTNYSGNAEYTGPLMKDVLAKAGMPATAKEVILVGLDGYQIRVPVSDFVKWEVVLAHTQNGKRLEIETKGPLLVMYPNDKYPKELRNHATNIKQVWALVSVKVQ